jgi:hypothetical protein
MKNLLQKSGLLVAVMTLAATSQATTYRWTWQSQGHVNGAQAGGGELFYSSGGGNIKTIETSFDSETNRFTYEAILGNQSTNGLWLAVSPGANPKGHAGELALFYVDASAAQPALLAYAYNGVNGHNSWRDGSPQSGIQPPDMILSSLTSSNWINNFVVENLVNGGKRFAFDIDATAVQNHMPKYPGPGGQSEWTGAEFGQKFGIWNHTVKGLQTTYNEGALASWSYTHEGWVDGGNLETVPEPTSMAALGLGVAAIFRRKKAKRA